jgi:hypothetical protein
VVRLRHPSLPFAYQFPRPRLQPAGADESVRRLAVERLFEQHKIANEKLAAPEWFFDGFTAAGSAHLYCANR